MTDEKMRRFLSAVKTLDWRARHVPKVWNDQYHEALSEGFVQIHFGGSIRLTETGHEYLSKATPSK